MVEPDVPKDSSTEISCILRALDSTKEILDRRGIVMPEHLVIEDRFRIFWKTWEYSKFQYVSMVGFPMPLNLDTSNPETDNCPREGKNQVIAKFSATAVTMGRLPTRNWLQHFCIF